MKGTSIGRVAFLLGTAVVLLGMWSGGGISCYLAPRNAAFAPWVAFGLLLLGALELSIWSRGLPRESWGWKHLVWAAPLAAGLAVRPQGLSVGYFAGREISAWRTSLGPVTDSGNSDPDSSGATRPKPAEDAASGSTFDDGNLPRRPVSCPAAPLSDPPDPVAPRDSQPLFRCPHLAGKADVCVDTIREGSWYAQMAALYGNPHAHAGRRIRVLGLADVAGTADRNWFLVGRMLVWCCAADATPFGLFTMVPVGSMLPPAGWVWVEGRLSVRTMPLPGARKAREVPVLLDVSVEAAPAPAQPNVFSLSY